MYENAVKAIIRPPRDLYGSRELGPAEFRFRGRGFIRKDFVLRNPRGMVLQCSHWQPVPAERPRKRLPCVVCLHGNSSSRVSAKFNLDVVLNEGATLLAIDFAGSGRSEGKWVTLGWWEKDDLATVLQHLREEGQTSSIALWGRSMGAATSLIHAPRDPLIDGIIADSPFSDLEQLIDEIVERFRAQAGLTLPSWVTASVVRMVQTSVYKRTNMDILRLKPLAGAHLCHVRALFAAGRDDDFVPPHHSIALYEAYGGPKEMVLLDGQDHNSQRPGWFQDRAGLFLRQCLHVTDELTLYDPSAFVEHPEQLRIAWARAYRAGAVSHRAPAGVSASASAAAGADSGAVLPEESFGLQDSLPAPTDDPLLLAIEQSKLSLIEDEARRRAQSGAAAADGSGGGAAAKADGARAPDAAAASQTPGLAHLASRASAVTAGGMHPPMLGAPSALSRVESDDFEGAVPFAEEAASPEDEAELRAAIEASLHEAHSEAASRLPSSAASSVGAAAAPLGVSPERAGGAAAVDDEDPSASEAVADAAAGHGDGAGTSDRALLGGNARDRPASGPDDGSA